MNVADEMKAILDGDEEVLAHYGMPRRSGRYPWGSGDDPYQHSRDFLGRVEEMEKQGLSEKEQAAALGIFNDRGQPSSTRLRAQKSIAKNERRMLDVETAKRLRDKEKMNNSEIGRKMGINESTVRSLLNEKSEARMNKAQETANFLKEKVKEKGMIDVGKGVELELRISKEKLNQALALLQEEGYPVYKGGIQQVTNKGSQSNQKVLCPPGTEHKEIYNFDNVHSLKDYISRDGGITFEKKFHYPESMDSSRLMIRYKEDGGIEKDGLVELRRGVPDLSLGESRYAQVRILVDGNRYIKGMARYSDDMPPGVDVIFNTNKTKDVPKMEVLKKIKDDPDNPFGSLIKDADQGGQYWYDDPKTGKKKLGLINKRAEEGDWTEWKDALPSQFLGKQSKAMAQKQLDIAKADKAAEFDELKSLTNPTIKKHLLEKFADECDAAAVHLKAAALPGQKYHVIMPFPEMSDREVYAPYYDNGTQLALIRYPHGGTFEIPILTVNNKIKVARNVLGSDVTDVIGINSKVAERLSGADFDGDTVMCIPTHDKEGRVKISSKPALQDLEGFDPKTSYGADKVVKDSDGKEHYYRNGQEYRIMKNTGNQMGSISNLITDMTLAGADDKKLARAVKHSMVVIDAEKHHLDYKQSELDNDIASLRKEYQAHVDANGKVHYGGASTLLSRSKGQESVLKRQGTPIVNLKENEGKVDYKGRPLYDPSKPEGAYIYKTADDLEYTVKKTNKVTGEVTLTTKQRKQQSTRMAETDDAYTLVSDAKHPMELIYADHANYMKALGNKARIEMVRTGNLKYDANAKATYKEEVASLNSKLNTALLNAPRERAAQRMANSEVAAKQKAYAEAHDGAKMKAGDVRKLSQQALSAARQTIAASTRRERNIDITDREWEAIQAGAVSNETLKKILVNSDTDKLRERATPRTKANLSTAKVNQIKAMTASYTLAEIADKLGLSPSTVYKYAKGKE